MTDPSDALSAQYDAEYRAAVESAPPACKCGHRKGEHAATTDRCRSAACGCTTYRPREEKARSPQPVAAPPPRPAALPALAWCGACGGTGNALASTDPDWRWNWCGVCWGTGVIEVVQ